MTIDIDIVRHNSFFFYSRRENGRTIVNSERIDAKRASQIYEANQDYGRQRTKGVVDFTTAPCEWSWTIHIEEKEAAHAD